jgi:histidinol-phosphatase (PHP family)
MHTPLCRHAQGEPEDYAEVAEARGLKGIIVTCHNPVPDNRWWHCMDYEQLPEYIAMIERANKAYQGRVDIRAGIECDYLPGMEEWLEEHLAGQKFHHVLGSIHPQVKSYRERFYTGDDVAYQRVYFENLALAAESRLFDTLSHPDLVKNEAREQWDLDRIWPDIERALDRVAATGTAMELNTSGLNKALPEMNPGPRILAAMHERCIPVVIGSDAHEPGRVGANWEDGLDVLESVGYNEINFFLERKRQTVAIDVARRSLKPLKS